MCREPVEGAQKLFGPIQTLARMVVESEKFYRQSRSD
jgi:hypothetical protein